MQTVDDEYLYIVTNRINDEVLSGIKDIEGVMDISMHPYKKYPIVKLLINGKCPIFSQVEDVCYRHHVLIFDNSNGREEIPNFTGTSRLEELPKSIASFKLLKELKGGHRSAILQDECGGSVSVLLMALGKMLEGVECFYLTPGRLKERADKICDILKDV